MSSSSEQSSLDESEEQILELLQKRSRGRKKRSEGRPKQKEPPTKKTKKNKSNQSDGSDSMYFYFLFFIFSLYFQSGDIDTCRHLRVNIPR